MLPRAAAVFNKKQWTQVSGAAYRQSIDNEVYVLLKDLSSSLQLRLSLAQMAAAAGSECICGWLKFCPHTPGKRQHLCEDAVFVHTHRSNAEQLVP